MTPQKYDAQCVLEDKLHAPSMSESETWEVRKLLPLPVSGGSGDDLILEDLGLDGILSHPGSEEGVNRTLLV